MAKSINEVNLLGVLGRDAETKFTPSGAAVTNFSIATEYSFKNKQTGEYQSTTDWHSVVLWNAEKLAAYLTKGSKVFVKGRLSTRSYEDKNGDKKYVTEVVADSQSVVLCSSKPVQEEPRGNYAQQSVPEDDVPF